jgi:hypothetical protein
MHVRRIEEKAHVYDLSKSWGRVHNLSWPGQLHRVHKGNDDDNNNNDNSNNNIHNSFGTLTCFF